MNNRVARSIRALRKNAARSSYPYAFVMLAYQLAGRAALPMTLRRLQHSDVGKSATRSVIDPESKVYVSLTSWGARVATVHLTIESIARGSQRPGRFVLWLDDDGWLANLPPELAALQGRGLEIRKSENYGPHTKAYPAISEGIAPDWLLVTADDDVIYPRKWLAGLAEASAKYPENLVAYRTLEYVFESGSDQIAPMRFWRWVHTTRPNRRFFALGVDGCAYPARLREALGQRGGAFLAVTPKNDDIWVNAVAAEIGVTVAQVNRWRRTFPLIPDTQDQGLINTTNGPAGLGLNDIQVNATYSQAALSRIRGIDLPRDDASEPLAERPPKPPLATAAAPSLAERRHSR